MKTRNAQGVWSIVVAAGSGSRFGSAKQFVELAGVPVLDRVVLTVAQHCTGLVVVVPEVAVSNYNAVMESLLTYDMAQWQVVAGGATRSESVRCGLAVVATDAEVVLVHDGARPLASATLFEKVTAAVFAGADAAVPALTVTDTVRWRSGAAIDRDDLVALQTPQAFRAAVLRQLHRESPQASDDTSLVFEYGGVVEFVAGEPRNLKLTSPEDLLMAQALLVSKSQTPEQNVTKPDCAIRVGHAFDVHAYSDDPQSVLVLGGVTFPNERGLSGHSDADVVAHVCMDAILGAAGLGDIGTMFPDTNTEFEGANSVELLRLATESLRSKGWIVGNIDCSVVLDRPKLAPVKAEMETKLSAAVDAPVTVTGRRTEGLGSLGRGEGVAAWAVALVTR